MADRPGGLGAVFGTPAASTLAGRLPRKTGTPATPPSTAADPTEPPEAHTAEPERAGQAAGGDGQADNPATDTAGEQQAPAGALQHGQKPASQPRGMPEAHDSATYQVSVYLLPAAVQAAERIRRTTGRFNADIAFDALDALRDQLAELVAARQSASRPPGSLFPGRRTASTRGKARDGRRQLWSLQATQAELDIIDRLCQQTGAASRSELISVAVETHYLTRKRPRQR